MIVPAEGTNKIS